MPMIYFSEDANESWHKLYRSNMVKHARQNSRQNRILDIYNRAVYMTDPKISLVSIKRKSDTKIPAEASKISQRKTQINIKQFIEEG